MNLAIPEGPVRDRVIAEHGDLLTLVGSLSRFTESAVFATVAPTQQALMLRQLVAMRDYLDILHRRLEDDLDRPRDELLVELTRERDRMQQRIGDMTAVRMSDALLEPAPTHSEIRMRQQDAMTAYNDTLNELFAKLKTRVR